MTHRDGFPRFSARSAWHSDAGHRKPCAPSQSHGQPESLGKPPFRAGEPAAGESVRASESLDDVPQGPRLPSCPPVGPADRLPDLYGSLSRTFGITALQPGFVESRSERMTPKTGKHEFMR